MVDNNYLKRFEGGKAQIEFYGKREQQLILGKIEKVVVQCLGLEIFITEIMVCGNHPNNPARWVKRSLETKDSYRVDLETADIFKKDDLISFESYQQGIDVVLSIPQN